jgi:hypothetical protein
VRSNLIRRVEVLEAISESRRPWTKERNLQTLDDARQSCQPPWGLVAYGERHGLFPQFEFAPRAGSNRLAKR